LGNRLIITITSDFHLETRWCGPPTANPRYAEAIDYYYVYGPSVDAIIGGYRELLDAWFWQGDEVAVHLQNRWRWRKTYWLPENDRLNPI
jgi:hypothetical protein